MSRPYSFVFKYIIIGDSGIGKSSILQAYTHKIYDPEIISTVGIEFGSNIIDIEEDTNVNKDTVKIQIWDTAGQERFRSITQAYYRGSIGIFIVYDITDRRSFENVKQWYNRFLDRIDDKINTKFTIIGNKSDKDHLRDVHYEEGKQLAQELNTGFFETSCKNFTNINEAIQDMTQRVYQVALQARNNNYRVDGIRISPKRYYKGRDISGLNSDEIMLLDTIDFIDSKKKCCK